MYVYYTLVSIQEDLHCASQKALKLLKELESYGLIERVKVSMHYYGHPEKSLEITRNEIIPSLLSSGELLTEDEQRRLLYYVGYHDDHVSLKIKHLRRHLNLGASLTEFQNLMKLQISDARAHVMIPIVQQRIEICEQLSGEYAEHLYNEIMEGK